MAKEPANNAWLNKDRKMNLKTALFAASTMLTLATGSVFAQDATQTTLDRLIEGFKNEGRYARIEFEEKRSGYEIKGITSDGEEVTREFDVNGNLVSEEIETADQEIKRLFAADGSLVSEQVEARDNNDDDRNDGYDDNDDDENDDNGSSSSDDDDDRDSDEDNGDDNSDHGSNDNGSNGDDENDDNDD